MVMGSLPGETPLTYRTPKGSGSGDKLPTRRRKKYSSTTRKPKEASKSSRTSTVSAAKPRNAGLDRNGRAPGHPAYETGTSPAPSSGGPGGGSDGSSGGGRGLGYNVGRMVGALAGRGNRYGNITAQQTAAHQGRLDPDPALAKVTKSGLVSVDDLLKLADGMISGSSSSSSSGGGGGSAGAMIDLDAIKKQYGDVRGGIDRTMMANLAQLNALKEQASASAGAYGQAADARLKAFSAMNDSQGAQAAQAAQAARQQAMRELQGQGVDQSVSAAMAAQGGVAASEAGAAAAAQRQRLENEMMAVRQDKAQRGVDLASSDIDARRVLDQSKLAAVLGVNAQEAQALDAGRQQNAQVAAAQAQYDSQRQEETKAQSGAAREAILQMLGETGYATPFRGSVESQLENWSGGQTSWKVMGPQMLRILQGTNDRTDAYNQMMDAIDQYDTDRETNDLSLYDRAKWLPQINHMLNRWYSQDTTRVDPDVAKMIMARLQQGL